jgi:hypothetical protein
MFRKMWISQLLGILVFFFVNWGGAEISYAWESRTKAVTYLNIMNNWLETPERVPTPTFETFQVYQASWVYD